MGITASDAERFNANLQQLMKAEMELSTLAQNCEASVMLSIVARLRGAVEELADYGIRMDEELERKERMKESELIAKNEAILKDQETHEGWEPA